MGGPSGSSRSAERAGDDRSGRASAEDRSADGSPSPPARGERLDVSGAVVGPAHTAAAALRPSFLRRHGLRLLAWGLLLVQVVLAAVVARLSQRSADLDYVLTGLTLVVVPLVAWAACRDLDALIRFLTRSGLMGGLLRAGLGAGLIAAAPQLFTLVETTSVPLVLEASRALAALMPVAVASGMVLVGIGAADVVYTLTAGFRHLSTRLMLLLLVSTVGTVAGLGLAGPEGRQLLLWVVERGHLEAWLAPLQVVERYAGSHVGGLADAFVLLLPFILLLAWRFGRNATNALADLGRAFRRVGRGDFDQAVSVQGRDEVAAMKVGFNQMLVLARERRFLETAFGRYLSPVLLERLKADRGGGLMASEARIATVLFADIRGFTAMSAAMSPEEVIGLLNRYVSVLIEVVARYDGYINKFIGDAVLVVWNAPLDQPDHAVRAVQCAVAMQRALDRANADGAFGARAVGMGVGINTGPLVIGQLGNERQAEFTVIGDTVNVASRACSHAAAGQVVLTGAVRDPYLARESGAAACFESLGLREIKGRGAMELLACRLEAFPEDATEEADVGLVLEPEEDRSVSVVREPAR
ncbi:MAG: adenylate/guanylate cyclase domain-containing protein [Deltaproteobacteria bacterium]|nr:adenylate/guanylate cyclase domain-containing protein [Deltaproteobacteria bacterium]